VTSRLAAAALIAVSILPAATIVAAQRAPAGQSPNVASRATAAPSWVHESWTVDDGLPINAINDAVQDRQGYIWLATFDGVVRFDGVRFTVYNSSNTPALSSNRIVGLRSAPDGALWIWTEQGTVTRRRSESFSRIALPDRALDELIQSVIFDTTGAVHVATSRGLRALRGDSLVFVGRPALDGAVISLLRRRDGTLLVGSNTHGLFRLDGDRATALTSAAALNRSAILSLFEDSAGHLWVGTGDGAWMERGGRFFELESGAARVTGVSAIQQSPTSGAIFVFSGAGIFRADSMRLYPVTLLSRDASRRPWTDGTSVWSSNGADVYRDGERVYTLPKTRRSNEPLEIIRKGFTDREGSIWLSTQGAGLHRLKPALFSVYSEPEGLPARNVYTAYADRRGDVWTAAFAEGLVRIDASTGRVTTFTGTRGIRSIIESTTGRMWVGGDGLFTCASAAISACRVVPGSERDVIVNALHFDGDGSLWVGTSVGPMRVADDRLQRFSDSSRAPRASVRAFASTRDGAVWMGMNGGGLARYRDGIFTPVTTADGLPSGFVRSLYADADGWLWIGTEGRGLARLDPRAWGNASSGDARGRRRDARRIISIDAKVGLFDEVIHQILEDDFGRLWMNTNRGIFWVSRAELIAFADGKVARLHSTAYSERDGLRNREGNGGMQPAGSRTPDGRLWFPTQDGVVMVNPARVGRDSLPPPVVVEGVSNRGAPLARTGNNTGDSVNDRVEVAPHQRDLQFDYTALTYLEPANVRFRYRLEPYEAEWTDAGNRRTAFYTQVGPGTYTFRVQASNGEGAWHEPGAALSIRVVPRFWETTEFRIALLALLALGVIGAFKWRVARLESQSRALERVVDERTAALREHESELAGQNTRLAALAVELRSLDHAKTRFFANVSHEFRTPLTLTIGPLEDLRERAAGDPQVERWLDIALRNSRRLLRLVNQILDVAKLEAGQMRLSPHRIDLGGFVRGIASAFESVAERRAIALNVDVPPAGVLAGVFDPDAVEKILTNLLSNALKFTPEGGRVSLALSREGNSVLLRLTDTGPGFDAVGLAHVFERFWQTDESNTLTQAGTGIGLSLVKELVELHGGTITVESSGPGHGAAFTVLLPLDVGTTATGRELATVHMREGHDALSPALDDLSQEARSVIAESADDAADVPVILLVDDSADLRTYVREQFEGRFRVLEAGDGAAGIELARRHLPDVVISDVMMPGTDGHALVRALRSSAETDFLPIILLTAQAENEQRVAGLEGGADDYLVKPFDRRELGARVHNLIASRRRLRELLRERHGAGTSEQLAHAPTVPPPAPPTLSVDDRTFVERMRRAIDAGLSDPAFGVAELARELFLDRSHLFRRTRELLGGSPSELVRRARLERAANLLHEGAGSVSEVAYAVGFQSVSHFSQCFREKFGVSPSHYRDQPAPR